ncbi:hypothetical protein DUNSADRAFT_13795 [Dunaliella salina]|uniref:Uncharacterized protein n=1 Tax=Dunaliella salina TaxID=3046 RepID=A0ABQ7G8N1_DUNSA|nr:hypothetical protein DUNSADRAFT_13795 [Dunaliella salina]|eukprot:KAF5830964.1 hypothetical protein DUNSADRAFT_13795 [Dunaliella salina]
MMLKGTTSSCIPQKTTRAVSGLNGAGHKVQRLASIRPQAATQETIDVSPTSNPAPTKVTLSTTENCEVGISLFPNFGYNAGGGGGSGTVTDLGNGYLKVVFDAETLNIPDLDWRTGNIFKVPLPPPVNIAIKPQRLEGTIKKETGEVAFDFDCEFLPSLQLPTMGPVYSAPPLVINTLLTSESTKGKFREGTGSRLNNGAVKLVGTSNVPKTGDILVDTFLMLPTDALAIMDATMKFE